MDALLRRLERTARALPGDPARVLAHARELARSGRLAEARDALRERLRRGRVDADGLSMICELAREAGALGPERAVACRALVRQRVGAGAGTLAPAVGFVGPLGARSSAVLGQLARQLGAAPARPESFTVAYGEHVLDLEVPLEEPWHLASGFSARSLRLLSLPGASTSGKFRRRLLRDVSALVVVVPAEDDERELGRLLGALDRDQRRASGVGLDELPVLFLYPDRASARSHPLRAVAWGLPEASWVVGTEEHVTALAWLLTEVARGVDRRLLRPRGR